MGDELLHSLAFSSMTNSSSLGNAAAAAWDFQNHLGVFNSDMSSQVFYMDRSRGSSPPAFFEEEDHQYYYSSSLLRSELGDGDHDNNFSSFSTTGYLEDVLFGFTSNSKRRRLLYCTNQSQNSNKNCWTSNFLENYCPDFADIQTIKSGGIPEMKTPDEETFSETYDSSSPTSHDPKQSADSINHWTAPPVDKASLLHSIHPIFPSAGAAAKEKRKKRVLAKVVYPFAVVKPGGFEGDVTLNDINERILMPPTRPVRHPVGDYACRPLVSPDGPGLFGKAVIGLTRIQTRGSGTITIVRTRSG